jgi:hypothetical protein
MIDARRKEIQRARELIGEAKDILEVAAAQELDDFDKMPQDLQNDDAWERAEEAIDALEVAAMRCDEAISACEESIQASTSSADEMRIEHTRRVLGE